MSEIHPTAVIEGDVTLADDVTIGPGCVLTGPVTVGAGTRLVGNVYLTGPLTMGADNVVYPFACLGFAPQHGKFDPATPGEGLTIGAGNTFREYVTVHRAFTDEGPTRIGDRNMFMASSHVGHDCQVADDCTFVNNVMLAGHVTLGEGVTMGGGAGIHQFCRIGRRTMISGNSSLTMDLPPFFVLTGTDVCAGVNLIGLRRLGMSHDEIDEVRWVYRTLYRSGLNVKNALAALRERAGSAIIDEFITFVGASKRGICHGRQRTRRDLTPA